jgi:hypothetical protein
MISENRGVEPVLQELHLPSPVELAKALRFVFSASLTREPSGLPCCVEM